MAHSHFCHSRFVRLAGVAGPRAAIAALLLSVSASALAEEAPVISGAAQSTPAGLEEVIVTASRREESEQKESRPISVLTGDDLQRAGVASAQSLNTLVPGLEVANSGPQLQIYVRGVGDRTVTSQTDPGVSFNLDGVYLPRAWEGTLAFFDLARVELLKGPQGTLYGRNASAGAMNLIPATPTLDKFGGFLEGDVGNYSEHRFDGAVNVPFNDWIAMRASFQTSNHNGYLSDGNDDADNQAGRFQLLLRPNDDFSARVHIDYMHNGGHGEEPVTRPLVDPDNPWIAQSNPITNSKLTGPPFFLPALLADSHQDVATWVAGADVEWRFSGMALTVLPAYVDGDEQTLTYAGFIPTPEHMKSKQYSLEMRLASSSEGAGVAGLEWVVGAYASHENLTEINFSQEGAVLGNLITDIPKLDDTSWALFGEGKYSVTDALRVIGGLRYTAERKTANGSTTPDAAGSFAYPNAATDCFNTTVVGQLPCIDVTKDFDAVNWRGGLEYDLTPKSMAYLTASTGFKAGGFFAAPPPNTYEPEKLTAYELGVKNRFFDDRLQANIELYYWDYKNLQEQILAVLSNGTIGLVTRNAAQAQLKGVDASLSALVTHDDVLSAEVEYNHAKYDRYVFDTVFLGPPSPTTSGCQPGKDPANAADQLDCSGFQLVKAPTWSGAVTYQHTFHLRNDSTLVFGAAEHFSSSYWLSDDFTSQVRAPAWNMTNVILTYNFAGVPLSVSGYGNNLENKPVYNYAVQSPAVAGAAATDISPPRTYGVRVRYNF